MSAIPANPVPPAEYVDLQFIARLSSVSANLNETEAFLKRISAKAPRGTIFNSPEKSSAMQEMLDQLRLARQAVQVASSHLVRARVEFGDRVEPEDRRLQEARFFPAQAFQVQNDIRDAIFTVGIAQEDGYIGKHSMAVPLTIKSPEEAIAALAKIKEEGAKMMMESHNTMLRKQRVVVVMNQSQDLFGVGIMGYSSPVIINGREVPPGPGIQ